MGTWYAQLLRLFICHTSPHKVFVKELKLALRSKGISAFVAHADIEPTAEWQHVIERALATADVLTTYLTPDFHRSKWTDQEVGAAVGRKLLIIPIKAGLTPYGFIGKYQAYSGEGKTAEQVARAITRILLKHKTTALKMSSAFVSMFEGSDSWAEAKANVSMLEEITALNVDLMLRLEAAVKENSQIRDAFGVPERVEKLIKRLTELE